MPCRRVGVLGLTGLVALVVLLTSAVSSCSSCSGETGSCMAPGVYVYSGALPVGSTVRTCVDGDCTTGTVEASPDPASAPVGWLIQDRRSLPAGDDVQVSITIVDPKGTTAGKLDEQRRVPDGESECTCAALIYRWTGDGHLERLTAEPITSSSG